MVDFVQACTGGALPQAVGVGLGIDPTGRVVTAEVEADATDAVRACLAERMRTWAFPCRPLDGTDRVRLAFDIAPVPVQRPRGIGCGASLGLGGGDRLVCR
jgi:hypothetical protein